MESPSFSDSSINDFSASDQKYAEELQLQELLLQPFKNLSLTQNYSEESQSFLEASKLELSSYSSSTQNDDDDADELKAFLEASKLELSSYSSSTQNDDDADELKAFLEASKLEVSSFSSAQNYAEELQLQEVLEASKLELSSVLHIHNHSSSSTNALSNCQICTEDKQKSEMFEIEGCPHSFCQICISKHVEYKLQENYSVLISCPGEGCSNMLDDLESLKSIMPPDLVSKWEEKIVESSILDSEKLYCPYEDCSEILVNDSDEGASITDSECPKCMRRFCAQCKVPWHDGFDCEEFQKLDHIEREKEMKRVLAKDHNLKECLGCKMLVGRNDGCIHMTCKCGFEFCIVCGQVWDIRHFDTCQEQEQE